MIHNERYNRQEDFTEKVIQMKLWESRADTVLGKIKSNTFQGLSSTLTTFFQTYSTTIFYMWHSLYSNKSVSNTDVYYVDYSSPMTAPFMTQQRLMTILEFNDFQEPLDQARGM